MVSDISTVVYSPNRYIDVDFSSDGSGTGAGFIASVSYLGESDFPSDIYAIYTGFICHM